MTPEVEIRTDNVLTSAGTSTAGPSDARRLHEWPDTLPETGGDPVVVAVMDSGIHEGLSDHRWFDTATVEKRFDATGAGEGGDAVGHGSGCASIIAQNMPEVVFYDVRIFGDTGRTGWDVIRRAYEWLIDRADEIDIVNMSWGARSDVPEINQLHDKLVSKGVHDVVAAGNTGGEGGSPSTARSAFSAGAVDANGDLTRFTSRDPTQDNPDVAALGKDVKMARAPGTSMGTPLNENFVKASGTSFAAPYTVAAYGTALYTKRMDWDKRFEVAAPDIPGSKADGEGLLKLAPALGGDDEEKPTANYDTWAFAGNDVMYVDADWLKSGDGTAELVEDTGDHVDIRFNRD